MEKDLNERLNANGKNCWEYLLAAITQSDAPLSTEVKKTILSLKKYIVELEKEKTDLQKAKENLRTQLEAALKTVKHYDAISADNSRKVKEIKDEFSQIQELNKLLVSFFQKSYILVHQKDGYEPDEFITKITKAVGACKEMLIEDGYTLIDNYNDNPGCFIQNANNMVQTTILIKPAVVRNEVIVANGLVLVPSKDNNQSQDINIASENNNEQSQRKDIETSEAAQGETMLIDGQDALNQSIL